MRQHPYSTIADDGAFSEAPFTCGPWLRLGINNHHFLDTRGKTVASDRYFQTPVALPVAPAAAVELARYYFTGLPGENRYAVRLILLTSAPADGNFGWPCSWEWQIRTHNPAGACVTSDPDWAQQVLTAQDAAARRRPQGEDLLQLPWPNGYSLATEVLTPWRVHQLDAAAALPRAGRVLSVWGRVLDLGNQDALYLRGVFAYGLRDGGAV